MTTQLLLPAQDKSRAHPILATFTLAVFLILFTDIRAGAQCDTFYNADAANQVTHTLYYPIFGMTGLSFTDLDNDGDLDCYLLNNGDLFIPLENKGTPKHPLLSQNTLPTISLYPYNSFNYWTTRDFEFADADGDGDKDLFVIQTLHFFHGTSTNVYDTAFRYYQNTGSSSAPLYSENGGANPLIADLADSLRTMGYFTFYDIDKDGDLDYTYTTYAGNQYRIYLNTGNKTTPHFTYYTSLYTASYGKPQYFDWNHDGLPDLWIAGSLYLNKGTLARPSFVTAPQSPVFTNGTPYILTDLNDDQQPEAYSFAGNLSTTAPIPVIDTLVQKIGNRSFTKYYSHQQLPGYQYTWIYNGKPLSAYHKPFIYAEKEGTYLLEITGSCGTGVSLPQPHFTYNMPLLTAASQSSAVPLQALPFISASVYPNPFSREVRVRIPQGSAKSSVVITDAAGRVLSTQTTTAGTLTTGGLLPKGMYLLQVWQNGQCVYRSTLLKQ